MFKNWRTNTLEELKLEYFLEWENKNLKSLYGDIFPTFDDFYKTYKNSKIVKIDRNRDRKISYRSHTSSKESLISLIKGYASWPEFRNHKTIERLYNGLTNGDNMPMPIIISKNGKMRIFGGNTRADAFFHLYPDGYYKAVVISV